MSAQPSPPRSLSRIAIVNRGEAAMRFIRAVKSLRALEGSAIQVIALYTEPDRDAPFVRHADQAIELPVRGSAVASYLDHDLLMQALRLARADAVWPGWGFVAEDAAFVQRVSQAGLRFLGPDASAMRRVGDKISAKQLAEKVGVPVTAWSGAALADADEAQRAAARLGYPLMLKASAGGGGRGIRLVASKEELASAFRSARAEAESAFGDGRLFLEKLVVGGRHIEVQIAADAHGEVVSLGCRDCSVQRRHQKLIEEAPVPQFEPEQRDALEHAALRIARQVGYEGVGTLEFLCGDGAFHFLEMNPRLQVEHGVSEEVAGVDLVQLQIRIARGEKIAGLRASERCVAIEARICAEDPEAGFLPAPGRIARFEPGLGGRVRVDSGVAADCSIPPDFDSLIAKVIATGATREEARARLVCALRDFELVVVGGASNKGFLLDVLEAPDYRQGGVDTAWLDRWSEARANQPRSAAALQRAQDALVAAAILAYQHNRQAVRVNFYADTSAFSVDRLPPSRGQQIDLCFEGQSYRLAVYAIGSWRYRVHLEGRALGATMREQAPHTARLVIDERVGRVLYDVSEMGLRVEIDGHPHHFGLQAAGQVRAGTPAVVVALHVQPGDVVSVGQPLGVVEAMKMEIGFQAPVAGVVVELRVRVGQQVAAGDVMLVIDPASQGKDCAPDRALLRLPAQEDPLETLLRSVAEAERGGSPLPEDALGGAIATVREEIRRVLLGYDANPERGEALADFLEAPLPGKVSEAFLRALGSLRFELTTFADTEQLFIRAPRASVSGELGPSNSARFRIFVRRLHAGGAGISQEFLGLVSAALAHYGVSGLEASDALERAVLRLLSSQRAPELRRRLVLGVIRRLTGLARAGVSLADDAPLQDALRRISRMRGLLPDALADAAIEAHYVIFEASRIERLAEQSSLGVERWLAQTERETSAPPSDVLLELAAAARRVFERIGRWITAADPARRRIALAAHVQRIYARPSLAGSSSLQQEGSWIHVIDDGEGSVVLAASAIGKQVPQVAERLVRAARGRRGPSDVRALELVVPPEAVRDQRALMDRLERALSRAPLATRFSVCLLSESGQTVHETFEPSRSGGAVLPIRLHGLHPEVAGRVGLDRFSAFDLERLPSEDGIYAFHGRSRDVPADERVFVLADVQGLGPAAGREAESHMPSFERAFYEATRTLRSILQLRDPRRRLQWNRIAIFFGPEVFLDPETAAELARRLAPLTRHLGIEKVVVRLSLLDREHPEAPAKPAEVVVTDTTGSRLQTSYRAPHRDPLQPAQDYERKLVEARRRRLAYPYEIIRLLTAGEADAPESEAAASGRNARDRLPGGHFEEYDLDPARETPTARPVPDRPYGQNRAAVIFGVITTPTDKVPEGMRRVLILSDPTMGLGALAAPECDRLVAALDLAAAQRLPVEWVPVSSGARIAMDSGTENLDATARVVRRIVCFTEAGGSIHVIVQGVNVGAQSYFDALATMLMHTRGILVMTPGASMVLTGRAALEASGAVSAEDEDAIGGFEQVMGPNGQAQYYARSLADAFRILYEHYRFSYVVPGESGPRRLLSADPPQRSVCDSPIEGEADFGFRKVGEIFDATANPDRKRPFPMRSLMAALADRDGGRLERWRNMVGAETAIVWDAHLGGVPIELIGIESHNLRREGFRPLDGPESWSGGTLFPLSSKKLARAINAASGNRPVVILANLSGFDGSPESLRKFQLEYGAEIARAVVNFRGPLLFLVVSRYHGGAYVVFSRELNDGLRASAIRGSFASVIGGGPAASVVFGREVRARAVADPRVAERERALRRDPTADARNALEDALLTVTLEKQAELAAEFDRIHSVERALKVGSLEAIIPPEQMRPALIAQLEQALAASGEG